MWPPAQQHCPAAQQVYDGKLISLPPLLGSSEGVPGLNSGGAGLPGTSVGALHCGTSVGLGMGTTYNGMGTTYCG